jgi:hypothetical protein
MRHSARDLCIPVCLVLALTQHDIHSKGGLQPFWARILLHYCVSFTNLPEDEHVLELHFTYVSIEPFDFLLPRLCNHPSFNTQKLSMLLNIQFLLLYDNTHLHSAVLSRNCTLQGTGMSVVHGAAA